MDDVNRLSAALLPIIQQALGMKVQADHQTVIRLATAEINAGKAALEAAGRWPYRMWETPAPPSEPMRFLRHRDVMAWRRRQAIAALEALVRQGKMALPTAQQFRGGPLIV